MNGGDRGSGLHTPGLLAAVSWLSAAAACTLLDWDFTAPATACTMSSPGLDLWTPSFKYPGDCPCGAEGPLCHALYQGSVVKIHEDGWHADLKFRKVATNRIDTPVNRHFWLASVPAQLTCADIDNRDYEVVIERDFSLVDDAFEIDAVPLWPDQGAYDAAPSGAMRRLFVITDGSDTDGQGVPRWYQPYPITFVKTCRRCDIPPCPLHTWTLASDGDDELSGLGVIQDDGSDDVIVAGWTTGRMSFGENNVLPGDSEGDIFFARLDRLGNPVWAKPLPASRMQLVGGLAVRASSPIVLAGIFNDQINLGGEPLHSDGSPPDIFVAAFGSDGAHRWSRRFGGSGEEYVSDAAVHDDGTIAVSGNFRQIADATPLAFDDFMLHPPASSGDGGSFIALFAPDTGAARIARDFGWPSSEFHVGAVAFVSSISSAAGAPGEPYLLAAGVDATSEAFVMVLDGELNAVHQPFKLGLDAEHTAKARAVVSTPDGSIVFAGTFTKSVDLKNGQRLESHGGQDIFIAALGPDLSVRRVRQLGGAGDDDVGDLAVAPDGSLVLVGTLAGAESIPIDAWLLSAKGAEDAVVIKFAPSDLGEILWASRFGGPSQERFLKAVVRADGRVLVGGTYRDEWQIGGTSLRASGSGDSFVVELAP
ncbi:regulatory protein FlaEY [Sorangium cellulosum So ce56]|uniref:Regulatory protein FlaEY n=1 Tax=Sorangium cellulosum (strain So ce56) TaxID=448385 RepID=A9GVR3_SORC5|nr:hypothetical protein [Sorangium cellulosum]CAN93829.1 regulatory protein FlaEY [Sorangium cellulosum So ce56]